ncbi:unnamed protein product [Clonostachys rosea]|uniref:2EXR domain-containing protein n=1 Tax=Bionectria ochroleuca TaxID=29856 RepID=A0ABY6U835_BIOOC|nr:unnamed protein product [Clonostachys rosea]
MSAVPVTEPASSGCTTFHLFPNLTKELRCLIWTHALPTLDLKPKVVTYKRDPWRKEQYKACDKESNPDGPKEFIMFDFSPMVKETLKHYFIRMVGVNREAREVTLLWARDLGYKDNGPDTRGEPLLFFECFHPGKDVVTVKPEDWSNFCEGPERLLGGPDILEPRIPIHPCITRILVLDSLFEEAIDDFDRVLTHYYTLTSIYITVTRVQSPIRGVLLEPRLPDGGPVEGRCLTWDLERQEFYSHGSQELGTEGDMSAALWRVADKLKGKFIESRKQKFEMVTVFPHPLPPSHPLAGPEILQRLITTHDN